jgi:hypothetical protein
MPPLLDVFRKRFVKESDEDLRTRREGLAAEVRLFGRAHLLFADRAHDAVDQSLAALRREVGVECDAFATIQGPVSATVGLHGYQFRLSDIGAKLAAVDGLAPLLHAAVDRAKAAGEFSPLTSVEFEAGKSRLEGEIAAVDTEIRRRELAASKAELATEETALERAARPLRS